jgi:hypothetical protein
MTRKVTEYKTKRLHFEIDLQKNEKSSEKNSQTNAQQICYLLFIALCGTEFQQSKFSVRSSGKASQPASA